MTGGLIIAGASFDQSNFERDRAFAARAGVNWQLKAGVVDGVLNESVVGHSATLPPPAHTAIVRGVNNTTGVALVEGYSLEEYAASRVRQPEIELHSPLGFGKESRFFRGAGPSRARHPDQRPYRGPSADKRIYSFVVQIFSGRSRIGLYAQTYSSARGKALGRRSSRRRKLPDKGPPNRP
jgi:hypothetical protein